MRLNLPNGAIENCVMYALEDFRRWNLPWNVLEGDLNDLRRGNYVFIDNSGTRRYGPFAVNDYREFMGRRLKIIGRAREAVSFTTTPLCFVNYHTAQMIDSQGLAGQTTYILVKLAPGADPATVQAEIQRRLPHNDVHTKAEWARLSRKYWIESTGIGLNMVLTVFLGCVVGIVVVAQTLYTSTMEHYKEFATVKAIGGSNWHVYGILVEQAVVAAVVGFGIGAGLSLALQPLMPKMDLKLILPPDFFGIVLLGTVLFCVGAALLSFRKVSAMDPALVFRG
jgi:putative ABC transport system permease protein